MVLNVLFLNYMLNVQKHAKVFKSYSILNNSSAPYYGTMDSVCSLKKAIVFCKRGIISVYGQTQ